jgi:hypothetical protein
VQNPFKPTAGATPPDRIGRTGLLDEFEYGLRQGSRAPGLLTIITGSRGIGKTVILSAAKAIARNHGWAVAPLHRQDAQVHGFWWIIRAGAPQHPWQVW